ncbi:hypothetical protein V8G54_022595 [Vigna mungo]|uniref:Uncharacterized protein n=1 Tax=Vigna mungo TaxID=3915 RepID=A0AAQ3RRF0_VIGMU
MAGKGGATPATYSPSLTADKKKPPLFKEDWVRPDGRGFHQCRPACKFHLLSNTTMRSLLSACNDNLNICFSIIYHYVFCYQMDVTFCFLLPTINHSCCVYSDF